MNKTLAMILLGSALGFGGCSSSEISPIYVNKTISEVKKGTSCETASIEGIPFGINDAGFFLKDSTGQIFVTNSYDQGVRNSSNEICNHIKSYNQAKVGLQNNEFQTPVKVCGTYTRDKTFAGESVEINGTTYD